jgi:hypothetical protein
MSLEQAHSKPYWPRVISDVLWEYMPYNHPHEQIFHISLPSYGQNIDSALRHQYTNVWKKGATIHNPTDPGKPDLRRINDDSTSTVTLEALTRLPRT